jgi:hypothetical protein
METRVIFAEATYVGRKPELRNRGIGRCDC